MAKRSMSRGECAQAGTGQSACPGRGCAVAGTRLHGSPPDGGPKVFFGFAILTCARPGFSKNCVIVRKAWNVHVECQCSGQESFSENARCLPVGGTSRAML